MGNEGGIMDDPTMGQTSDDQTQDQPVVSDQPATDMPVDQPADTGAVSDQPVVSDQPIEEVPATEETSAIPAEETPIETPAETPAEMPADEETPETPAAE